VLTGLAGRGKSAAALWLADHVLGSIYYPFAELLRHIEWARRDGGIAVWRWKVVVRSRKSPDGDGEVEQSVAEQEKTWLNDRGFWNWLRVAPLLVVDDLGTRGGYTDPQYDNLLAVLESRKFRPLVVVSNVGLGGLRSIFDDRVFSRLGRGTLFELRGHDRRLAANLQQNVTAGRLAAAAAGPTPSANGAK
jgi:hypothetical protein